MLVGWQGITLSSMLTTLKQPSAPPHSHQLLTILSTSTRPSVLPPSSGNQKQWKHSQGGSCLPLIISIQVPKQRRSQNELHFVQITNTSLPSCKNERAKKTQGLKLNP